MSKTIIPEKLYEILKERNYFITGSHRFGVLTKTSDLDIVVCIEDKGIEDVIKREISESLEYSNYNNGYKFTMRNNDGTIIAINIIPLHPLNYVTWYHAANLLSIMPNVSEMTKESKHGLHEVLCGLVKMQFRGIVVNSKNYESYCKSKESAKDKIAALINRLMLEMEKEK